MKKKHLIFLTTIGLLFTRVNAESQKTEAAQISIPDTTTLLLSYVENDSELRNLTIAAKKANLSYQSTKIDNGFDITLSSGTVTLQVNDDGSKLSAKPSVKAKLPMASNLSLTGQTNISYTDDNSKISDTSFSLGVDIISSAVINNKITRLKAERSLLEAERKIQKRAISAEKEFYNELKKMLSSISSIISKQEKFYSDSIDFEAKKIQGYSQSSSTYRQSELKVKSDERDVTTAFHTFIHDSVVFYKKCGYDIQIDENVELMSLVPSDLEALSPIDIRSLDKELYTEIESAVWNHTINSMERNARKNYSLSASAGYTIDNSSTKTDTIDAGINGSIGGLSLGLGMNMPLSGSGSQEGKASSNPSFTLSATLTPNTFRKNNITSQQNELTEEQELISIESAEANYETKLVELEQKLDSLLWEKESAEKNLAMYEDLERDMAQLYSQGYISENEYLSSKNNLNSNIIKRVSNLIDLIIYNDDVISNFVSEKFEIK